MGDIRRVSIFALLPSVGIIIFVLLYGCAAAAYPGGSVAYPHASGFDWMHNYWCDLLTPEAINGLPNPAMWIGIVAMIFLCGLVAVFFFQFADAYIFSKRGRWTIKISGVISMICAALIFTDWHNVMIGLASVFALIPVFGIFYGLIKTGSTRFLILGVVVGILLVLCNYFYYTGHFLEWLPLFQKVTMLTVLTWIVLVNVRIAIRK